MSAGPIPEIYRPTARKSTVSKAMKNAGHSASNSQVETKICKFPVFNPLTVKIEEEIGRTSFVLQSDNEIEQMIVEENVELLCHEVLVRILDEISSNSTLDKIFEEEQNRTTNFEEKNVSRKSFDETHGNVSIETKSTNDDSNSLEFESQTHDEISEKTEDFLDFERELRKIRVEQEQERSLLNNRLIQTLKRQHEELINFYHQTKKTAKTLTINRVDRAQQTTKSMSNDFQVQTDLSSSINEQSKNSVKKSNGLPTKSSIQVGGNNSLPSSRTPCQFQSSNSTGNLRTRPTTNGTVKSQSNSSHDLVDLTEEDEEEQTTRRSTATTNSNRQSISTTATQSSTSSTAAPRATRIQSSSRSTIVGPQTNQSFPLRPLPEQNPFDSRIARPQLSITQENGTVRLTWNLISTPMESIQNYEIYAYKQNATVINSDWKKIGSVKSMRLPMAVTLKEFQANSHYAFAVRAISIDNGVGPFCEPKTIFTGNNPVQPLHTSQLLNVPT